MKTAAAIAGRVEQRDQMPGSDEHAIALTGLEGSVKVKVDKRVFGARMARCSVVRDVLQ